MVCFTCRCLVVPEMSGDNVKLFVGNLPLDATQDEINKLFAPYGEINTCSLLRQYAFVTLKGEGAADRYYHSEVFPQTLYISRTLTGQLVSSQSQATLHVHLNT